MSFAQALEAPALDLPIRLLTLAGRRQRLPIITYHRILPAPDPLVDDEPDENLFRFHMRYLARHFQVLKLPEAVDALRRGCLPAAAAVITFDDGYANNFDIAFPILRELGLPATFFVATRFLHGECMWNDNTIELVRHFPKDELDLSALGLGCHTLTTVGERKAALNQLIGRLKYLPLRQRDDTIKKMADIMGGTLPGNIMMKPADVRALHDAGMDIGGHTVSHPILTSLTPEEARCEIQSGFDFLSELLGIPPRSFAYPNGKSGVDFNADHTRMVKNAGFSLAVSTRRAVAKAQDDPFVLPRIQLWGKDFLHLTGRLLLEYAR